MVSALLARAAGALGAAAILGVPVLIVILLFELAQGKPQRLGRRRPPSSRSDW